MNNNEQVETNPKMDYKKNNKIFNWFNFSNIYEHISEFLGIFSALNVIIKNICYYFYSIKAEAFYGIPRHYFYENAFGDINIKLILVVIFVLILFLPLIVKNTRKKIIISRLEASGYSFIITLLIVQIFLDLMIGIIDVFNLTNINSCILWGGVILILIFIFIVSIVSFCVFFMFFTSNYHSAEKEIDTKNSKETQTSNGIKEKLNKTYMPIVIFSAFACIVLFVINIEFPDKKNDYEVVFEGSKPKKILVTEYKDCFILMDIEKIDGKQEKKLFFKKSVYEISKKENLKIKFVHVDEVSSD
ncbi:hypothetical protein [Peptostreptococcus porci]|uniref:hypothetical protein n=1 Tax=Peptostreptococcus porci TaxID=2652282 RepID=UPI002A8026FB|nr:hypothetical protein [Peptostreptococcus porci]MDY4128276.1 hypothetical protein [Peptostreptococcus porci]